MSRLPHILIAEDEMLVAMSLEEMLGELGYEVKSASNLEAALKCAEASDYVAAILDFRLHGQTVEPVAEVLAKRGIPYAISSGFQREDLRSPWANVPLLPKPYVMEDVSDVLGRLVKDRTHVTQQPAEQQQPAA